MHIGVYGGKAKSKRYVLRRLLKVATEVAERTDSGMLFQREGAHELKVLPPVLVLILGMDRVTPLFDLRERDRREVAIKAAGAKNLRVPNTYICSYNVRSLTDQNTLEELANEV